MVTPDFPIMPFTEKREPLISGEEARQDPKTAEGNTELADEHIAKGRVHQAITRYKIAARIGNDAATRTDLGDAYAFAELPIKAAEQYRRAMKAHPDSHEPHFGIAELYTRYGRWQAAAVEYKYAVELCPTNAYYWYKLASAQIKAGSPMDAIVAMEEAVALTPDDGFYRFELAALYADARRDDEAVAEMERAAAIYSEDDYYISRLAMLYARVGKFELAADSYREAIRVCPHKLLYRVLLGDTYHSLGLKARAECQYTEAKDIDSYEIDLVERARRYTQGEKW